MRRETYEASKAVTGDNEEYDTLVHCNNLLHSLVEEKRIDEATSLARENIPLAVASLGPGNDITLKMRYSLARALSRYDASLEDRSEAVTILEDVCQTARQVFGAEHPLTRKFQVSLFAAQYKLEGHGDPLEGHDDPKEALMQMLAAASKDGGGPPECQQQ